MLEDGTTNETCPLVNAAESGLIFGKSSVVPIAHALQSPCQYQIYDNKLHSAYRILRE